MDATYCANIPSHWNPNSVAQVRYVTGTVQDLSTAMLQGGWTTPVAPSCDMKKKKHAHMWPSNKILINSLIDDISCVGIRANSSILVNDHLAVVVVVVVAVAVAM